MTEAIQPERVPQRPCSTNRGDDLNPVSESSPPAPSFSGNGVTRLASVIGPLWRTFWTSRLTCREESAVHHASEDHCVPFPVARTCAARTAQCLMSERKNLARSGVSASFNSLNSLRFVVRWRPKHPKWIGLLHSVVNSNTGHIVWSHRLRWPGAHPRPRGVS